jgi:tRNA G18 (ribose-2'-O)-methylase SpoU
VIEISSLDDPRIAAYRGVSDPTRLDAAGLFVVEGRLVVPRLLELAAQAGRWYGRAQSVLLSPAAYERLHPIVDAYRMVPTYVVPQAVMDGLAGFNMHRGCLALARRPPAAELTPDMIAKASRLIVLERVNNPDNIGGIFRSAAALGADLIVLSPGCGDPLYRKAVRTSMGATLEIPYTVAPEWPGALSRIAAQGCAVVALSTSADATWLPRFSAGRDRIAILAGAEGPGLSREAVALASYEVTIPMTGRVDSLNVATAIAIALYHLGVRTGA